MHGKAVPVQRNINLRFLPVLLDPALAGKADIGGHHIRRFGKGAEKLDKACPRQDHNRCKKSKHQHNPAAEYAEPRHHGNPEQTAEKPGSGMADAFRIKRLQPAEIKCRRAEL